MRGVKVYLGGTKYSFKVQFDVDVHDYVIVDTVRGIQLAQVVEVMEEAGPLATKYAFQKVDMGVLDTLKAKEVEREAIIAKLDLKAKRLDKLARYRILAETDQEAAGLLARLKELED